MTTTPDSRIRDDWTLPAETAAPPPTLGAIDTSTTAGRIAVMQAWLKDWRSIECLDKHKIGDRWEPVQGGPPSEIGEPMWNRDRYDYRIAPPPAQRSALQNARDVIRHRPAAHNPDSLAMMALVSEIDIAPAVWFGEALLYQCGITGAAPGRYRLLRDDA